VNLDGGIDEIPLPPLARGRLWLCGKHAIGPDPDGLLERVGADGVVCLNEEHELAVPLDEALDRVRRHRPAAGPEVGPQLELVRRLHDHLA